MVQHFVLLFKAPLEIIGGVFLCYIGWSIFKAPTYTSDHAFAAVTPWYGFCTTALLTFINPMTILMFIAILANFSADITSTSNAMILVTGVFIGSAFWWILLCGIVSWLRKTLNHRLLSAINKISGIVVFAFGIQSLFIVLSEYRFMIK